MSLESAMRLMKLAAHIDLASMSCGHSTSHHPHMSVLPQSPCMRHCRAHTKTCMQGHTERPLRVSATPLWVCLVRALKCTCARGRVCPCVRVCVCVCVYLAVLVWETEGHQLHQGLHLWCALSLETWQSLCHIVTALLQHL